MFPKDQFLKLTKKYFGYLAEDHNLEYGSDENAFCNEEICILIEDVDYRDPPDIWIWLKSEPFFTKVSFSSVFSIRFNYYTSEEAFKHLADVFKEHVSNLLNDTDNLRALTIAKQKRIFLELCRAYRMPPDKFLGNKYNYDHYKKYFDYVKEKEPTWDAEKDYELLLSSK